MDFKFPGGADFGCVATAHPKLYDISHNSVSYWIRIPETHFDLRILRDSPDGKTVSGWLHYENPNSDALRERVFAFAWSLVLPRISGKDVMVLIENARKKSFAAGRESIRQEFKNLLLGD